ncbi:MAG: alpha/beta fold hydrolase [Candidatus Hydrogenedentes bacterium]|nr:alpha/beta fold hydrolase [Candidatus Hydrogenedentota bacterium]
MPRFASLFPIAAVCALCCPPATAADETAPPECVLDEIEHLYEDLILELPRVRPLCEELGLHGERVDIGGCALYCEQEGEGRPLVLLHGGPGSTHHLFHPQFSRAAQWARVIYYDQRGCGRSDYKSEGPYSIGQAVDDLDALRAALGIERWVVVGSSYGGTLAQCYAAKYPERLLGLVLIGSASSGLPVSSLGDRQHQFMTRAECERVSAIFSDDSLTTEQAVFNAHLNGDWKRQSFYRPTIEELARLARYEWKHDSRFRGQIAGSLQTVDLEGVFDRYPLPILMMDGKWDLTWGAEKSATMHACFPDAELVVFDRAGHCPYIDMPDAFFSKLKAFVDALPPPSDEAITLWKRRQAALQREKEQDPAYLVRMSGYGAESSKKLAARYSKDWLRQLDDPGALIRLGFALYDAADYAAALPVFKKAAVCAPFGSTQYAIATIWQGHMLDLLGERDQAIAAYNKAAATGITHTIGHDQYALTYSPVEYAAQRLQTPFTRIENTWQE